MFTGIVEEIGALRAINRTRKGAFLRVETHNIYSDAKLGDSVAINGVCLSVTDIKDNLLGFDVIGETFRRTALGELKVNAPLNLERSLKLDSRIGGHFVSGHIDYRGRIEGRVKGAAGTGFRISLPGEFSKFIAEKGSVALDGVSLTVAEVKRDNFTVYLIPHTLKVTTLGKKTKGDTVNIEVDLLAKYLLKQRNNFSLKGLLEKYDYL